MTPTPSTLPRWRPVQVSPARHMARAMCLVLALLWQVPARADVAGDVRMLSVRGEFAAALQRVDQALAQAPRDAPLRFLRAVVLMDLKRDAEAMALFSALSVEFPELPDPHNNMALLQARAGQPDLALQSLQTALRNDPGHRTARLNLGQVYLMLAVQAWDQAAAMAPLEADTRRRLEAVRSLVAPVMPPSGGPAVPAQPAR